MPLKTVTFRAPEEKVLTLDAVAEFKQRDRSFIINEAVDNYLSLYEYQRQSILEGIRQDDAGEVTDHETVREIAAGWVKRVAKK